MRNRKTSSAPTDHDSAAAPVATPKTSRVNAKTCRRPNRSASSPPSVAPRAIPTKPIDPIQDSSVAESDHCAARAAMTKEMSPTSIASSAQPRPEPMTSRPCSRVKGSRSSRSARDSEVVVVVIGGGDTRAFGTGSTGTFGRGRSSSGGLYVGGHELGGAVGGQLGDPVRHVLEHLEGVARVDEVPGGLGGRPPEERVAGAPDVQRRHPDGADRLAGAPRDGPVPAERRGQSPWLPHPRDVPVDG